MHKKPEITAATRQRIIDAFWDLYKTSSIGQIRIKEITDIAHINRSTFYQYFPDIYSILEQEEDRLIQDIIANDLKLNIHDIDSSMERIADMYISNGEYLCLLTGEKGDPQFLVQLKSTLFPAFYEKLSVSNSPELSIIFDFGINGLIAAFRSWYTHKDSVSLSDFIKIAKSIVENGIFKTLKG